MDAKNHRFFFISEVTCLCQSMAMFWPFLLGIFHRMRPSQGAGDQEVLDSRVYMEATVADVPAGPDRVLTGRQLAELCYRKYGCYYDMALLQFKPLGDTMARQVASVWVASLQRLACDVFPKMLN